MYAIQKLNFTNQQHREYFFRLYEGLNLQEQLPELYRLYQMAEINHACGRWLDYATYETSGIGFQDGIDVEYIAYDPDRKCLSISAATSLRDTAYFIDEFLEVHSGDDLLGRVRRSTAEINCTTLTQEFIFDASAHRGKQLHINYTAVWSDSRYNQLKALIMPVTIDVNSYLYSCIKSVNMEFPKHIHTPVDSPVVICFNRTPSSGTVDIIYPLIYKNQKPCLLLDCIGDVIFDEPKEQLFSTIDINSFELKINGSSGFALYRLSYDDGGVVDRTQKIIKSFTPTADGFHFALDKDWKDYIPTINLPAQNVVKLTFRVEFKLKNGMRSVLQIASGSNECASNVWKIPSLKLLWGCLAKGSRILMANGIEKPIEQIEIGESVQVNYTNMAARVTNCWCGQEHQPLVLAETADKRQLKATANHPVITSNGIVPIGELQVGDWLIDGSGEPCEIQRISQIHVEKVYNLTLEPVSDAQIYVDGYPVKGMTMICDGFIVGDNEMQNTWHPVNDTTFLNPQHIHESEIKQAHFQKSNLD